MYKMGRYNETNILKCTEVKYHSGLIVNVVMPRDIWKVFREVPHVIFFFFDGILEKKCSEPEWKL